MDDKEIRVGFSCTVPVETFQKLLRAAEQNRCHWTEMVEKLIERS